MKSERDDVGMEESFIPERISHMCINLYVTMCRPKKFQVATWGKID